MSPFWKYVVLPVLVAGIAVNQLQLAFHWSLWWTEPFLLLSVGTVLWFGTRAKQAYEDGYRDGTERAAKDGAA